MRTPPGGWFNPRTRQRRSPDRASHSASSSTQEFPRLWSHSIELRTATFRVVAGQCARRGVAAFDARRLRGGFMDGSQPHGLLRDHAHDDADSLAPRRDRASRAEGTDDRPARNRGSRAERAQVPPFAGRRASRGDLRTRDAWTGRARGTRGRSDRQRAHQGNRRRRCSRTHHRGVPDGGQREGGSPHRESRRAGFAAQGTGLSVRDHRRCESDRRVHARAS